MIDLIEESDSEEYSDCEDGENQEENYEQRINQAEEQIRRSDRERRPPKRYGDYILLTY